MLIYKNTNGEQEAVLKTMVVRFSRKEDLSSNNLKPITFIHLTNNDKLKSLDDIGTLLKRLNNDNNFIEERNLNDLKEEKKGNRAKNKTNRTI